MITMRELLSLWLIKWYIVHIRTWLGIHGQINPFAFRSSLGLRPWELWLFQKKLWSTNIPYPSQITFWKYNGKSIIWLFEILTETLQKKLRIEILTFSFQICFRNQFSTSGSGQTENTQIRVQLVIYNVLEKTQKKIRANSPTMQSRLHPINAFFFKIKNGPQKYIQFFPTLAICSSTRSLQLSRFR